MTNKKFAVHRYEIVRVKISPVDANSSADAILVTDNLNLSVALARNAPFTQDGFTIEEVAFCEGVMSSAMVDTLVPSLDEHGNQVLTIDYDEERNYGVDSEGELYELDGNIAGEEASSLIRQIAAMSTSTEPGSALLSAEDQAELLDRVIAFARRHQTTHTATAVDVEVGITP
jgi:hypothetical protein